MRTKPKIGFVQGRLSPMVNNRIQQFPWDSWQAEFVSASNLDFKLIEWTIDTHKFLENPLMKLKGWEEINKIAGKYNILIPSVTCDYFMETPPWKNDSTLVKKGISTILKGMRNIGSKILVIPLVDNSSPTDSTCIEIIKKLFTELIPEINQNKLQIAFECDLNPEKLSNFIEELIRIVLELIMILEIALVWVLTLRKNLMPTDRESSMFTSKIGNLMARLSL